MNKFIEIYDNIISKELENFIEDLLLRRSIPYNYAQNITDSNNNLEYSPGFVYNFYHKENNPLILPHAFTLLQVLYSFVKTKNIKILDIFSCRSFLHIPTIKKEKNQIHTDMDYPHWVCLYYVCDSDGDTILFDDNQNEIKRITPKKGRIVFFDGSIPHCSSRPTTKHRSIINFDFIGEKL
jgi:hypothetical protein